MTNPFVACPRCLHSETSDPSESIHDRQKAATFLHSRLKQVQHLIATLEEERAALSRKLNEIQSRTTSLPAEILSTIFEHVCCESCDTTATGFEEEPNATYFPLVLSAVSTYWRALAQVTPRLWTYIVLEVTPLNVKKRSALLRHFVSHSETTPLSLSLQFSWDFPQLDETLVDPSVDEFLIQNLPKVQKLRLFSPPPAWLPHLGTLPRLVACYLDVPGSQWNTFKFSKHAPLQYLTLRGPLETDPVVDAPWTSITSVTLSRMGAESTAILLHCPNLIRFIVTFDIDRSPEAPVALVAPRTMQYLEVLHVNGSYCGWIRAILQYLSFTALKDLRWTVALLIANEPNVQGFFRRLPNSLTKLYLSYPLFQHINNLNDMEVQDLSVGYYKKSHFRSLLLRLTPSDVVPRPLPLLEKLHIRGEDFSELQQLLLPEMSGFILDFLQHRMSGHKKFDFRVDTHNPGGPVNSDDVTRLKESDFNVVIHEWGIHASTGTQIEGVMHATSETSYCHSLPFYS